MQKRQSLSIDLDSLFPGETLEIGGKSIDIRPLSIEQIATISKKLKSFGAILSESGVTWQNYNEGEGLFKLAVVLLDNFPDILEEASNVDINDLKVLPIECIVLIIDKILEVNLKSKEALVKNFKSLTEKFLPEDDKKTPQKGRKTKK